MQIFASDFPSMKPISLKKLIPKDWALLLEDDFANDKFKVLEENLNQLYQEKGELIAPLPENIFKCESYTHSLSLTEFHGLNDDASPKKSV